MSRGFKINRAFYDCNHSDRVNWLDEFADLYGKYHEKDTKTAVEVARERQEPSLQEQISAIMGQTHTVESKVKEMQERTGLTAYLKRYASKNNCDKAFSELGSEMKNDIISFLKNKISAHHGQINVPALQYDVLNTFKQHGVQPQHVNTEDVACCISNLIEDELRLNPPTRVSNSDLGRVDMNMEEDGDNADYFKGLMSNN